MKNTIKYALCVWSKEFKKWYIWQTGSKYRMYLNKQHYEWLDESKRYKVIKL